jgi:hypothetical protein
MRALLVTFTLCVLGFAIEARAANETGDYTGPFKTQDLYNICSKNNTVQRAMCYLYIQGLMFGLNTQRSMQEHDTPVCLPEMDPETARLRILKFIDETTGGKPARNKDGGDWMAFMGLAAGNTCKR